ncbi:hypothetical protein L2E82_52539 [Cichorium intybus]|nr:hypothetical protein L2E82_52539 [Cichorium intybus]
MGCPQAGAGARRYIAETARAANHDRRDGISTSLSTARALAAAPIRTGPRPEVDRLDRLSPFHIRPGRIAGPHSLPPDNFKHSLTLFSKSFSSFPRGTCLLSVSRRGLGARSAAEDASPDYNSDSEAAPIYQAGLIPVRSPLLRESLRALDRMALGATCVQKLDGSRDLQFTPKYRILLRSSSMREPEISVAESRL